MELDDAAVVQKAAPAVVSISTWKMMQAEDQGASPRRIKAYGSGFIVDSSGIVVTNKHVIDGAFDIKAVLDDGSVVSARLIAASPLIDLAVVKIEVDHPLPSLDWGESGALHVGDPVLTIGNALGWGTSVSAGIVSGLNRNLMDSPFDSYIQTDATINHGNSGGPLVDRNGKVVGINTALYNPEQNGGFIGIGFAIPASTAKYVTTHLLEPKQPAFGWLGFNLQDMTAQLTAALGVARFAGAIVSSVDPSGPAAQASLKAGDVLERFNGKNLSDSRAFMRAIASAPIGQPAQLVIWRAGKDQEVSVTVAPWPSVMARGGVMTGPAAEAMMQTEPHPGVKLAPITEGGRKQYGLSPKLQGVLITQVEPDCEVSDLGVKAGDVIVAVQEIPTSTPDAVWNAIKEAHEQHRPYLALLVQNKSGAQWISISMSARRS